MSKFPKEQRAEEPVITGTLMHGAFECQTCGMVSTEAVHDRREERLRWRCVDGHESSIAFKI